MSAFISVPCVTNMRKELGRGLFNRLKCIGNPENNEILHGVVLDMCFTYQFIISPPQSKIYAVSHKHP